MSNTEYRTPNHAVFFLSTSSIIGSIFGVHHSIFYNYIFSVPHSNSSNSINSFLELILKLSIFLRHAFKIRLMFPNQFGDLKTVRAFIKAITTFSAIINTFHVWPCDSECDG